MRVEVRIGAHHLAEILELVLQAREEVAVVGVHAHLPQLVVVRAVAFVDARLLVTAQHRLRSRSMHRQCPYITKHAIGQRMHLSLLFGTLAKACVHDKTCSMSAE